MLNANPSPRVIESPRYTRTRYFPISARAALVRVSLIRRIFFCRWFSRRSLADCSSAPHSEIQRGIVPNSRVNDRGFTMTAKFFEHRTKSLPRACDADLLHAPERGSPVRFIQPAPHERERDRERETRERSSSKRELISQELRSMNS